MDIGNNIHDAERHFQTFYPGCRLLTGWYGLAPMPGQCFAVIQLQNGQKLQEFLADSTTEALHKLISSFRENSENKE